MGRRWALIPILASSALVLTFAGPARASSGVSSITHTYSASARVAASSHWTRSAMSAAAGLAAHGTQHADPTGPPPGTPNPVSFNGIRTVGALFFTSGGQQQNHFCTASVVRSATFNLVLTAAHCVDFGNGTFAQNVVYVPMYHNGIEPYGAWPVASITVTSSFDSAQDINSDYAFLQVTPPNNSSAQGTPIQGVTGGLTLGTNLGYNHKVIQVIGYNNTDSAPEICQTSSFFALPQQEEFLCNNYNDGTSGGPWIMGLNPLNGTGTVFGDIGGFEQGGDFPWASYSSYYD